MTIDKKIQRLKAVNLHKIVNEAAREKRKQIIKLNQDQMWLKGIMDIDRPGQRLKYAAGTIAQKRKKATFKKTSFITLRWFGDFYESMRIVFFSNRFEITADDIKWIEWLEPQDRFGDALGLTDKSMAKLRNILKPEIIIRLKRAI